MTAPVEATLGQRIKQSRRELAVRRGADVTQQDIADVLGVCSVTVCRWENDAKVPPLAMIRRLATVLQTSPSRLAFGGDR